ncbi:MAG: hypothetical protein WBQ17_00560 [Rhizomicrobium sp.]
MHIIAAIAPTIHMATLGVTVFENSEEKVDAQNWHLNETAIAAASRALAGRYSLTSEILPTDESTGPDDFAKVIREHITPGAPPDLYLVILSYHDSAEVLQARMGFEGIGVSKRNSLFPGWPPLVHAFGTVALYDGKTLNLIAARKLQMSSPDLNAYAKGNRDALAEYISIGLNDSYAPIAPVQYGPWPSHWSELSADRQNEIRTRMTELLSKSVDFTTKHMFFADAAAPP